MHLPPIAENRNKFLSVYTKFLLEKRKEFEIEEFLLHPGSTTFFPALAGFNGFLVGF